MTGIGSYSAKNSTSFDQLSAFSRWQFSELSHFRIFRNFLPEKEQISEVRY